MPPKDLKMSKQKEVVMINVEWLEEKSACSEGVSWFLAKYKDDSIAGDLLVEVLIKDKKLDWANWLITKIMTYKQRLTYAVYTAEQVAYLWKDEYPNQYKIWKNWVAEGCPENMRNAAWNAAWNAAGAATWVAAWAATLTKIINYGLKLLKDDR